MRFRNVCCLCLVAAAFFGLQRGVPNAVAQCLRKNNLNKFYFRGESV